MRTDNSALKFLKTYRMDKNAIGRWIQKLEGFKFKVIHRERRFNQHADALTKITQYMELKETMRATDKQNVGVKFMNKDEWDKISVYTNIDTSGKPFRKNKGTQMTIVNNEVEHSKVANINEIEVASTHVQFDEEERDDMLSKIFSEDHDAEQDDTKHEPLHGENFSTSQFVDENSQKHTPLLSEKFSTSLLADEKLSERTPLHEEREPKQTPVLDENSPTRIDVEQFEQKHQATPDENFHANVVAQQVSSKQNTPPELETLNQPGGPHVESLENSDVEDETQEQMDELRFDAEHSELEEQIEDENAWKDLDEQIAAISEEEPFKYFKAPEPPRFYQDPFYDFYNVVQNCSNLIHHANPRFETIHEETRGLTFPHVIAEYETINAIEDDPGIVTDAQPLVLPRRSSKQSLTPKVHHISV